MVKSISSSKYLENDHRCIARVEETAQKAIAPNSCCQSDQQTRHQEATIMSERLLGNAMPAALNIEIITTYM